jgi:acyl-CoA hydrolase
MDVTIYRTYHLVKSEDLNHHGTLYAGRSAEWFVESGFIAAASLTRPENIVCLKIHGMLYRRPIHLGEVIEFESRIVLTGRSRVVAYVEMKSKKKWLSMVLSLSLMLTRKPNLYRMGSQLHQPELKISNCKNGQSN